MKEKYLEAEMDVVEFDCQDVICTSATLPPFPTYDSPGNDEFL